MPPRNASLERWRGEVTAHLADISRRLDDFGERMEKALAKHADDDRKEFNQLDDRMSTVEQSQSKFAGKMAVVSAIAALVGAALTDAALRHFF
jgi:hypothetical protein